MAGAVSCTTITAKTEIVLVYIAPVYEKYVCRTRRRDDLGMCYETSVLAFAFGLFLSRVRNTYVEGVNIGIILPSAVVE